MGLHSGATWRTRLNYPRVASMRRCVKLLWSIVEERTDCIHYVGALTVPERGLGRSPGGNRIWRILALNSDIWLHEIYKFSNFSENQVTTMYAFFYLFVCSFHVHESWHDVNILIILVVKLLVRHPPGLRTCSYARDFSNKLINQSIHQSIFVYYGMTKCRPTPRSKKAIQLLGKNKSRKNKPENWA